MDNSKFITFIKGILAGICIAIGGAVFLALLPDHKIAGAIFFSVGLLTICTQGFNLFTGKACYILDNKIGYLLDLLIVWIGNIIGAFIIALFINFTRLSESRTAIYRKCTASFSCNKPWQCLWRINYSGRKKALNQKFLVFDL